MANNSNMIPIPGRLHSVATDGQVAGANEIYDDAQNKNQSTINSELINAVGSGGSIDSRIAAAVNEEKTRAEAAEAALDGRVDTLEEAVGSGGSIDTRISNAVAAEATARENADNALDGRIDTLEGVVEDCAYIGENDGTAVIADFDPQTDTVWKKAQTLSAAEKAQVQENIGVKEWLNNLTGEKFASYTATSQTTSVTQVLPSPGSKDTVYRVGKWNGTQYNEEYYSDYAWDGSAYVQLNKKSIVGEVFDISEYHGGAKYADLAAALDSNNGGGVPVNAQKGGMSVKFVLNSDNKYVQYRLMANAWSTTVTDWQGVDDEPTAGSENLVKSNSIVGYKKYNVKDKYNLDNALLGYVLNLQGEESTSQYVTGFAVTDYIAVHAGNVIEYAYGNANENIAIITLAVYNESKEIINVFKSSDTGSGKYYISDINAAYIRYVVFDDTYFNKNNQYLKVYDTTWNSLHNLTQRNFFSMVGASLDHYISSTGVITASNQYTKGFAVSDYISVNYKDVVKFAYAMPTNISMGTLNVYNANKELIGTYQSQSSGAGEYIINQEAAAFIRYNIASIDYFSGEQYLIIRNGNIVDIVDDILTEVGLPYIVNVGPSREITKFIDGLSLAMQHPGSKLYVDYGEYDIMTEYGAEANIPKNETLWGPVIGNNIHVVCEKGTVIKADCATLNLNYHYKEQFSILNVIGSFTLENATLIGKNIRYCVHDDTPIVTQNPCHSKYINCDMTHQGFDAGWSGYNAPACLGMGDSGGSITIEGGSYSSPNFSSISIHNSESARNSVFTINNIYTANDVKLYTFKPAGNTVKTRISNSHIGSGITYQDSEQTRKFNVTQFNIETA